MTENKTHYELSALLGAEEARALKEVLEKHGAELLREHELVKIRLAYPIAKTLYAFLACIRFKASPEAVQKIRSDIRLIKEVLRHTFVRASVVSDNQEKQMRAGSEMRRKRESEMRETPTRPKRDPFSIMSNEALEEKIKELQ